MVFANEKVRPDDLAANPDVRESARVGKFRVLVLDALVRVELTKFRRESRMLLRDMIEVGLIDATWQARLPKELADRLQSLLDTPEG